MVRRVRLTRRIVDRYPSPKSGERRLADTEVQGFGLRLWSGPNGGGRAFDLRAKDAEGRWTRCTFQPFRDAAPPVWSASGRIGDLGRLSTWLHAARDWARDMRDTLRGLQTPREIEWHRDHATRAAAELRPLGEQIDLVLREGREAGWSDAYVDAIDAMAHRLPDDLRRTPLGSVDPDAFGTALARLPAPLARIEKLREFMSKLPESGLSAHAGHRLAMRNTTRSFFATVYAERADAWQDRLATYEPHVPAVLDALRREDVHWVPAMALSMYLRTGAKQAPLLEGRWSRIHSGHWYPYAPRSRASWFWAREHLEDDLPADLVAHRQRVAETFGATVLMFPSATRPGQPITSFRRAFRSALRRAEVPDGRDIPLRDFALVAKSRNRPAGFMQPNNMIFRIVRDGAVDEIAEVEAVLSKRGKGWTPE